MRPRTMADRLERQRRIVAPAGLEQMIGYGLTGLAFESGHVIAMRRFTASTIGPPYSAVWFRDPLLRWTFFTNVEPMRSCPRYFGPALHAVHVDDIEIAWRGDSELAVSVRHARLRFALRLGATPVTRLLGTASRALPESLWERERLRPLIGPAATSALRTGLVTLAGRAPSGHSFLIRPLHLWRVRAAACIDGGLDLGPMTAPAEQAHVGEFVLPGRPLFAAGRTTYQMDLES